jgi:hypothetical protein
MERALQPAEQNLAALRATLVMAEAARAAHEGRSG